MSVEITWIGHASFRISSGESVVYIDPWKLPPEMAGGDADVVFVSHSHYDHCSPPDVEKVSKADTTLVAPGETIAEFGAANGVTPGERVTIRDVIIEAVAAYNIDKDFHPKGNHWLGAVITIGGVRVYYAGDTDLIPEMGDLRDVDVALLPVGGTYTLNAAEAVRACEAISPQAAIPYHWGDIVGSAADAQTFTDNAPCPVHLLRPGESVTV